MIATFDEKIKNLEREIIDLKTERQKVMAATSTLARELTCQSKSVMNSSNYIETVTQAVIIITPAGQDQTNNFVFAVAQNGISAAGDSSFAYESRLGQTDGTFELRIWTRSYSGTWNVGEQKTITHMVRIIATDQFTTTITERAA